MRHETKRRRSQPPLAQGAADESTERTQLYTDINLYLESMQAQFITGQVNLDDGWDGYLAQLSAMGLERLMEIEQTAYDRLMGA